jgi:hypothetical protein
MVHLLTDLPYVHEVDSYSTTIHAGALAYNPQLCIHRVHKLLCYGPPFLNSTLNLRCSGQATPHRGQKSHTFVHIPGQDHVYTLRCVERQPFCEYVGD